MKKGKIIILTIMIMIACFGTVFLIRFILDETGPIISLKQDNFTIEYGTNISSSISEYVNINKSKAKKQGSPLFDSTLETDVEMEKGKNYPAVGTYQCKITYKSDSETIELPFTVSVEDTVKPEIVQYKDLNVYVGQTIDWNEYFGVKDLSKCQLEIDDSDVDMTKAGTYQLEVTASDESGNKVTKDIEVSVQNPEIVFGFQNDTLTLRLNQTTTLKPHIIGSDSDKTDDIKYAIDDEEIASINESGRIKPKKKGETTIRASLFGAEASFKLKVV